MSEENVERLRDAYAAWNRGDSEAFLPDLHPQVEFHQAAGFPGMGVYRGPKAVSSAFKDLVEAFPDFKVEPEDIIELEDGRLLALVRPYRARRRQRCPLRGERRPSVHGCTRRQAASVRGLLRPQRSP